MFKKARKYVIFAIIASMVYVFLHGVLLFASNDVYGTPFYGNSTYLYHKNISCPVVEQNKYKVAHPDTEMKAVPEKLSVAEQRTKPMCWHCTWKPLIMDAFVVIALFALLCIVIKENNP